MTIYSIKYEIYITEFLITCDNYQSSINFGWQVTRVTRFYTVVPRKYGSCFIPHFWSLEIWDSSPDYHIMIWYDIYLLTAIGLTPGGSSAVHIYTQTIHRTTQFTQTKHGTTQLTKWEECGPCPVFENDTLALALQLGKRHEKPSVRVAEECQMARWKQNIQHRTYVKIRIRKHNIHIHCESYVIMRRILASALDTINPTKVYGLTNSKA